MNLLRALATISSMTLLSRILGFVRDFVIARIFGAGMLTDAADTQGIKDENGLPLVFTRKQLGRKLTLSQTIEAGKLIYPLVWAEVVEKNQAGKEQKEDEKN